MVASSGPCVFRAWAPRKLSPSSIWTSALASGRRPIPPCSSGTNGHHSPCERALPLNSSRTSSKLSAVQRLSAGMHSSWTNFLTLSRIARVSSGISKSIMYRSFCVSPDYRASGHHQSTFLTLHLTAIRLLVVLMKVLRSPGGRASSRRT